VLEVTMAPAGMPDWVRPLSPSNAWIGWCWVPRNGSSLQLVAICDSDCLTLWYERAPHPAPGTELFPTSGGTS
jgi:hypothetical protein